MILSMTGYGAAECVEEGVAYVVGLRSVNNRFLKLTIKLPESLQFLEPEIEKLLKGRIGRGTVIYSLRVKDPSGSNGGLNIPAIQDYVDRLSRVRIPEGLQGTIDLAGLAQLLLLTDTVDLDDDRRNRVTALVRQLTERAVDALTEMRRVEGKALREDLHESVQAIRSLLEAVRERAPMVVQEYHQRLHTRVGLLMSAGKFELEADALAREVAVYAERCDVNEEVSRLTSHLDQFEQICDRGEQAGRTLDFLSQELLREANTIASKSNDAVITRNVVEIKGRIDRLKEQAQNVE